MTLQEFKAWFEGFTEDMSASPSKKQWERIKKRVKEIDGAVTTYPVFVDRYWPSVPRNPWWICTTGSSVPFTSDTVTVTAFNASQAMLALGKADYQSIS